MQQPFFLSFLLALGGGHAWSGCSAMSLACKGCACKAARDGVQCRLCDEYSVAKLKGWYGPVSSGGWYCAVCAYHGSFGRPEETWLWRVPSATTSAAARASLAQWVRCPLCMEAAHRACMDARVAIDDAEAQMANYMIAPAEAARLPAPPGQPPAHAGEPVDAPWLVLPAAPGLAAPGEGVEHGPRRRPPPPPANAPPDALPAATPAAAMARMNEILEKNELMTQQVVKLQRAMRRMLQSTTRRGVPLSWSLDSECEIEEHVVTLEGDGE